jgi:hypothetical protein
MSAATDNCVTESFNNTRGANVARDDCATKAIAEGTTTSKYRMEREAFIIPDRVET